MLFKPDVPTSHRLAFVLAVSFTLKPFITAASGLGFHLSEFWSALAFWFIVFYQWRQRARGLPAEAGDGRFARASRGIAAYQTGYMEAPAVYKVLHWLIFAAVAVAIYFSLR